MDYTEYYMTEDGVTTTEPPIGEEQVKRPYRHNKYYEFALAAAAGGATDARVLLTLLDSLGSGFYRFSEFRDLVERVVAARFPEAVPWTTSDAHFEVDDDSVVFFSSGRTRVCLHATDAAPRVLVFDKEMWTDAPADHYRVVAMSA